MRRMVAVLPVALASGAARGESYTLQRRTGIGHGRRLPALPRGAALPAEYWSDRGLVVDDPEQRLIVDCTARQLTIADKERRTYSVLSLDQIGRQLSALDGMVQRLLPELRDALGVGRRIDVTATSERSTIAGHPAREYAVSGDDVRGSVWTTEDTSGSSGRRASSCSRRRRGSGRGAGTRASSA